MSAGWFYFFKFVHTLSPFRRPRERQQRMNQRVARTTGPRSDAMARADGAVVLLYTGGIEMTTTASTSRWCFFCEGLFDPTVDEKCPRVCDGGGHESLAQPDEEFEVRRGSSLHVGSCPRSDPHPLLPRSVPCLCASSQEAPKAEESK